jgi:hypothetical protein
MIDIFGAYDSSFNYKNCIAFYNNNDIRSHDDFHQCINKEKSRLI